MDTETSSRSRMINMTIATDPVTATMLVDARDPGGADANSDAVWLKTSPEAQVAAQASFDRLGALLTLELNSTTYDFSAVQSGFIGMDTGLSVDVYSGSYDEASDSAEFRWGEGVGPLQSVRIGDGLEQGSVAVLHDRNNVVGISVQGAGRILSRMHPSMGKDYLPKPSDDEVRQLLSRLLENSRFEGRAIFLKQAVQAQVVDGPTTFLSLDADKSAERAPGYRPLPLRAYARRASGDFYAELLVWADQGFIDALELAWFCDYPPSRLPRPSMVIVEG